MSKLPDYIPEELRRAVSQAPNIVELLDETKSFDVKHTDVLDTELVIIDVSPKSWMSKDCAIATAFVNGEQKLVLFTSVVLAAQLLKVKDTLPVKVKIAKRGKRYHFTV